MDTGALLSGRQLEKEMTIHCSTLAWESYGQRSLAGYSPWDHKRIRQDLVNKQQK